MHAKILEALMITMTLEGLHTATIGSFPLDDSERNRVRILDDLIALKIDFPNYPQLTEMGEQFLVDIEKGLLPPGLESFDWAVKYLERKNMKGEVKLKACLTGPFTLASYVKTVKPLRLASSDMSLFNTALANKEEVTRFTEILVETCEAFGREASMVFIDEPVLSLIVGRRQILFGYEEEDIVYTYNRLKNACGNVHVGTHICGRISPILANTLLKTDLDILSHEFFDTPENFCYDPISLEERGKTLAVGCISTRKPRIEDVKEIRALMVKAKKKYGENLIFTPDCGFKNLIIDGSKEVGYQTAIQKLRNMVRALSTF